MDLSTEREEFLSDYELQIAIKISQQAILMKPMLDFANNMDMEKFLSSLILKIVKSEYPLSIICTCKLFLQCSKEIITKIRKVLHVSKLWKNPEISLHLSKISELELTFNNYNAYCKICKYCIDFEDISRHLSSKKHIEKLSF